MTRIGTRSRRDALAVLARPALVLGVLCATRARRALAEDADRPSSQEIEEGLTCQCGCGLTVHSCNHLNCSSGIPLKQEAAAQIAMGKTRDEIFAHFEEKYGEKILSSPTKRGFNLTAWITPFAVIGTSGLAILWVITRWRRSSNAAAGATAPLPDLDPSRRSRLDEALRDFDRRS